jgi:DNA polymerase-1
VDLHQHVADILSQTTRFVVIRKDAKTLNFAIIYGAGLPKLAMGLASSVEEARVFLDAYHKAFPGIRRLQDDLKHRARSGQPVRTTGGRLYYVEPPVFDDFGNPKTFEYKMCNTLIQGSAADQTKQAMIRVHDTIGPGYLILSVHDEIVLSVPTYREARFMDRLREAMDGVGDIDVPIASDGVAGLNWAEMKQ